MKRATRLLLASAVLLAGCGDRGDQPTAGAENFVPPVTRAPTPMAGQRQTTPLTAYVGHYPSDAVDGVSFFDRTEVASALVEIEPDEKARRLIVGRDATTVPIFASGQRIAAHGCEAHDCAGHNWTLLIAADGNRDSAALCLHDAAAAPAASRWTTRAGTEQRSGDCPQAYPTTRTPTMLEHVPQWLGHALRGWRAGEEKLAIVQPELGSFASLDLSSLAFAEGARLPVRCTADGAGVSPPLAWRDPPAGTARLALLVEDADSPTPQPLVHAVVWGLPPIAGQLAEGEIAADGAGDESGDVGINSYRREGWLPPDPPTGHGEHRYAFQLFALDDGASDPGRDPGRSALIAAMAGHVLAAGVLIGTYSREEAAPIGPAGATATA